MAKIGRNDPCLCGSGRKYKRCCLTAPTLNPNPVSTTANIADPVEGNDDICDCCIDALNERADRALDLILDGHVDAAEAMAHDLMLDFPQEVEGIDLLSMVSEVRGQRERAAELLRRAIDIVDVHPHHDAETRVLMHQRLKELEHRA
jgi:SEC-C motif-containing protein